MGEVSKSAAVTTNDPANPNFTLLLRAHFKPADNANPMASTPNYTPGIGKRVGVFSVAPSDRWTTSTIRGQASAVTMYLYNNDSKPLLIKQMIAGGTDFTATMQTIENGKRFQVNVATNPALKPGQYHQTLKFITDSKETPEINVELEATVYAQIFATPTSITLPVIPLEADPATLTLPSIYVRKIREGGLKIKTVYTSLPFLKLSVTGQVEGQVYKIDMRFDKQYVQKGVFKGTIHIETNDPDLPVIEVPIQGAFN
jgi:hypothetical protein